MIAKTVCSALAAALLGYASAAPGVEPAAQKSAPCPDAVTGNRIEVTVTLVKRVPTPSIDPIDLTNCKPGVRIHWQLDAAGWQFRNDGIVITDDYEGQFSNGHAEDDKHVKPGPGRHHYFDNRNAGGKRYKYNITVYPESGSGKALRNDPNIINRP